MVYVKRHKKFQIMRLTKSDEKKTGGRYQEGMYLIFLPDTPQIVLGAEDWEAGNMKEATDWIDSY